MTSKTTVRRTLDAYHHETANIPEEPPRVDAYLSTSGSGQLAAIEPALCQTRYQVRFGHPRSPSPLGRLASRRASTTRRRSRRPYPPTPPGVVARALQPSL